MDFIISNYKIDIVQCSYNIIDNRILTSVGGSKIKKENIEVHARSIFLQGLLVNRQFYQKKYLKNGKYFLIIGSII